ncbi:bromodomain-containing protein DDB_G0280777-like isoform X2 [Anopheles funestus]|uniref:bromodomain-containing protein DDB_G0280777-like isoform X2 n=1 Tax=Anopheles funestus TaxID=62324 RepID=UPI0020C6AEB7|nr:bromodomain-containing protein DDB_G0280777-like isoform X2 [Anopheles funestus]
MESKLAKLERDTITNSLEIVHHKIRLLMEVWKMFFDEICYLDYLTSLPSSIEQFLGEIYCLTMNFCVRKTQRIRELQTKMFEMRRILGVTNSGLEDDWDQGHMSLDRKLTQLQQRINSLQQQTVERKRLMEQYTLEEVQLLKELGEAAPPHEPLCEHSETGVLPDAQKMAQFADYLNRLRAEKVKRIAKRDELQSIIRKKANLLDWVPRKERHRELINEHTLIPSLDNLRELQRLDGVLTGLLERKVQQAKQNTIQQLKKEKKHEKRKKPIKVEKQTYGAENQQQQQQEQEQQQQQQPHHEEEEDLWSHCSTVLSRQQTSSPPPAPPSSPNSEVEISVSSPTGGLFERTIEAYMRVETKAGRPANRDKIIEEIFRRFRASINVWWGRCLILPNERQQCKVLYTNQLDEDAFVAHIEQQKLLQSYYHENEAIFRLIYQWAEQWNRAVQLQRETEETAEDKRQQQQQQQAAQCSVATSNAQAPQTQEELAEVNEQLVSIRKQLESKCCEFEQRCQVKFTMYGMPVMQVLMRCQEKREKLMLPDSCTMQQAPVLRTKALYARQQLSPEMALELGLMLRDLLREKQMAMARKEGSDTDDSNRASEEDANGSSNNNSSSDDDCEVDQKRDDELLEEAFASATAAVTTKNRMHSVNGHPTS